MAIPEWILNLVVTPSATLALLFALPVLGVVKSCKFLLSLVRCENVRGKVVLITGASSGIGEHIAYEYAKRGARLVLVARREQQLHSVRDKAITLGAADAHVILGDVTKERDCEKVIEVAIQKFGRLDHLVNNAGNVNSFFFGDCKDTQALHATVDTDFWGPIYMTHFALPELRRTKGKIMVIASIGSWLPHPREAIYNGAKAGVLQFFDTLRVEESGKVGITIVMPGFTESEATGGKLVGEKGEMIQDSDRRDAHFGPQPMAYASTVARASVKATLRGWRYVITPYFYSALMLYRLIAPELIDLMFYNQTVRNPKKPFSKQAIEATGVNEQLYAKSTVQKGD